MKKTFLLIISVLAMVFANAQTPERLQQIIEKANKECPMALTDGLTLQSVSIDDNNVIYTYDLDTTKVPLAEVKAHSDLFHDSKAMELATDTSDDALLPFCLSDNISIIYRITSGTDSFDIVITPSDLQ